jgi:hypothetical protein
MGGLAAEVSLEPLQCAFGVVVQQDPHQLDHVLLFKNEIHHFTHVLTLRPVADATHTSFLVLSPHLLTADAPGGVAALCAAERLLHAEFGIEHSTLQVEVDGSESECDLLDCGR